MNIDTKRLATDAAYWNELEIPSEANWVGVKNESLVGWSKYIMGNEGIEMIPRPTTPAAPEWDGEGLPPVGCECEATPPIRYSGSRLRVLCHDEGAAICRVLEGDKIGSLVELCANEIRPIPTKAQRDRDELSDLITDNIKVDYTDGNFYIDDDKAVNSIIAAGWRKDQ